MNAVTLIGSFVVPYTVQMVLEKIFDGSGKEGTLQKKIRAVFDRIIPAIIQPPLYAIFWQNLPYVILLTYIGINLKLLPLIASRGRGDPGCPLLWEPSTNEAEIFLACTMVVLLFRTFSAQCCKFLRQQVCPSYERPLRWLEKILVIRFQIGEDSHFWIYYFGVPYVCYFTNQGMPLPSPSDDAIAFLRHLVRKTPSPYFPPEAQLSQTYSDWKERAKKSGIYDSYKAWLQECAGMPTKPGADTPATTLPVPEAGNSSQLCRSPKSCEALRRLLCSLTGDLITYPVKDSYGRHYEYREIGKWLAEKEKEYPPERLAEMDPEDRKTALLQFCPQNTHPIARNTIEYAVYYHWDLVEALEALATQSQFIPPQFKEGLLSYIEGVLANQKSRAQKSLEETRKYCDSGGMDQASSLRVKKDSENLYYIPSFSSLRDSFKPTALAGGENH